MITRLWRLAVLCVVAFGSLLAVTVSPVYASVPDGTGWAANVHFVTADSVRFAVDLPGSSASGTATWDSAHNAVKVKLDVALTGKAITSCVTGDLVDAHSEVAPGAPDVTVASATRCSLGTTKVTQVETPAARYHVNLCEGSVCSDLVFDNYVVFDMEPGVSLPAGTGGSWRYISPTVAHFVMKFPGAKFKGTLTSVGNNRVASGTVKLTTSAPGTCAQADELGANFSVVTCVPGQAGPFGWTDAGEIKLGVTSYPSPPPPPTFLELNMFIPLPQTL
jgi:hypothetical protein